MINIAIMGLGVVGSGTADLLTENRQLIERRLGQAVHIKYILDIRDMPDSPYSNLLVKDVKVILQDPEVSVVAELMGGSHPAFEYTLAALEAGKSVVTSNKEVVANFGVRLMQAAAAHGVSYLFEASTGGGIPVIRPLARDLAGNVITEISGILNGTTNYILTRMWKGGVSFEEALSEAQALGYAERDPSADVEGKDTCRKICILGAVATGRLAQVDRIYTEGISAIRLTDVRVAEHMDASIKLLGRMVYQDGSLYMMTAPFIVRHDNPLSRIDDVFNGVLVSGNYVGDVMFYGRGAGAKATASAVVADILALAAGEGPVCREPWREAGENVPADFANFVSRNYIAMSGVDSNAIDVIFGSVEYLPTVEGEIAFLTAPVSEREAQDNLTRLSACGGVLQSRVRLF